MTIAAMKPSPINLLILATLVEAPMHPYEIQRLAIEREKTSVSGVKRGSIYHAVQKLEAAGLIEAVETSRAGGRPERTVYRLTDAGRDEVYDWLENMLRRPRGEVTQLFNALEFLALLDPPAVVQALEYRVLLLDRELGGTRAGVESVGDRLPRIFRVEAEYQIAMLEAERAWVLSVVDDLKSGRFTWSREELREWAARSGLTGGVHRPDP